MKPPNKSNGELGIEDGIKKPDTQLVPPIVPHGPPDKFQTIYRYPIHVSKAVGPIDKHIYTHSDFKNTGFELDKQISSKTYRMAMTQFSSHLPQCTCYYDQQGYLFMLKKIERKPGASFSYTIPEPDSNAGATLIIDLEEETKMDVLKEDIKLTENDPFLMHGKPLIGISQHIDGRFVAMKRVLQFKAENDVLCDHHILDPSSVYFADKQYHEKCRQQQINSTDVLPDLEGTQSTPTARLANIVHQEAKLPVSSSLLCYIRDHYNGFTENVKANTPLGRELEKTFYGHRMSVDWRNCWNQPSPFLRDLKIVGFGPSANEIGLKYLCKIYSVNAYFCKAYKLFLMYPDVLMGILKDSWNNIYYIPIELLLIPPPSRTLEEVLLADFIRSSIKPPNKPTGKEETKDKIGHLDAKLVPRTVLHVSGRTFRYKQHCNTGKKGTQKIYRYPVHVSQAVGSSNEHNYSQSNLKNKGFELEKQICSKAYRMAMPQFSSHLPQCTCYYDQQGYLFMLKRIEKTPDFSFTYTIPEPDIDAGTTIILHVEGEIEMNVLMEDVTLTEKVPILLDGTHLIEICQLIDGKFVTMKRVLEFKGENGRLSDHYILDPSNVYFADEQYRQEHRQQRINSFDVLPAPDATQSIPTASLADAAGVEARMPALASFVFHIRDNYDGFTENVKVNTPLGKELEKTFHGFEVSVDWRRCFPESSPFKENLTIVGFGPSANEIGFKYNNFIYSVNAYFCEAYHLFMKFPDVMMAVLKDSRDNIFYIPLELLLIPTTEPKPTWEPFGMRNVSIGYCGKYWEDDCEQGEPLAAQMRALKLNDSPHCQQGYERDIATIEETERLSDEELSGYLGHLKKKLFGLRDSNIVQWDLFFPQTPTISSSNVLHAEYTPKKIYQFLSMVEVWRHRLPPRAPRSKTDSSEQLPIVTTVTGHFAPYKVTKIPDKGSIEAVSCHFSTRSGVDDIDIDNYSTLIGWESYNLKGKLKKGAIIAVKELFVNPDTHMWTARTFHLLQNGPE